MANVGLVPVLVRVVETEECARPQPDDDHKMSVREWWESMRRKLGQKGQQELAKRNSPMPSVPEKWAE